jgi:membrane-bound serine protease (ClpP class)
MFFVLTLVVLIFLPSPWNLLCALATGALFAFEVAYWHRRMRNRAVQTGRESLVGSVGEVVEPLMPVGQIRVLGELWQARSGAELPRGTPVRVLHVDGLMLEVESASARSANGAAPQATP